LSRRDFLKLAVATSLLWVAPARASSDSVDIYFDFEQSELTDSAKGILDQVAEITPPLVRLRIAGNCDSAEAEPDKLGFARANAVHTHLLRHKSMARVRFDVVNEGVAKPMVQTPPQGAAF
jgi:outer membrane protein OmpA-like peptidoglycan-associated protein